MNQILYLLRYAIAIIIGILAVILYILYSIFTFIIPGKCWYCRQFGWFRMTILTKKDIPVGICRKCYKYKEIIIVDNQ